MRSLLRDCQAAMKIHLVRENLVKGERRIWIAPVDNFIFWLPASPLNAYVISLPIYIYIKIHIHVFTHVHAHRRVHICDHISFLFMAAYWNAGQYGASIFASLVACGLRETYPLTIDRVSKGPFKSVLAAFCRESFTSWQARSTEKAGTRGRNVPCVSRVSTVFPRFPLWTVRSSWSWLRLLKSPTSTYHNIIRIKLKTLDVVWDFVRTRKSHLLLAPFLPLQQALREIVA